MRPAPTPVERAMGRIASVLGVPPAKAYTAVTGLGLAVLLAVTGLPPVIDAMERTTPGRPVASAPPPSAAPPATVAPVAQPVFASTEDPLPARGPVRPVRPLTPAPSETDPAPPAPPAPPPASPDPGPSEPVGSVVTVTDLAEGPPTGVAVAPDGTVWVAAEPAESGLAGPGTLLAISPDGRPLAAYPVPGQSEGRTAGVRGVVVDDRNRPIVADASTGRILRLDPTAATVTEIAALPDLDPCLAGLVTSDCEPGITDAAPEPAGMALEPGGTLLVADRAQGVVWRIGPDGPEVVVRVDDRLPGDGPVGVATDGIAIEMTVTGLATTVPPGDAGILRFEGDELVLVATIERAAVPGDIVRSADGTRLVALRGAGAVLRLAGDGQATRLGEGELGAPASLAFAPGGLLVPDRDGPPWRLRRLAVADRPGPTP